jgi:hypothetical protein
MQTKILEIRDKATFFPVVCVNMNPGNENTLPRGFPQYESQLYLLRRCGYPCDNRPNILYVRAAADGRPASNDPYFFGDRTNQVALNYIIDHWDEIEDGDVIDVEYILGEAPQKKVSERYETGVF